MVNQPLRDWLVAVCILYPLSTAAVVLRLLAVHVRGSGLKPADYLVILSWLCQTGYLIDVSVEAEREILDIDYWRQGFWISQWFWAFGVSSFRLAVLLLYMDLFSADQVRWRVLVGTASVIVGYLVACIFTICLLCRPVQFNWEITLDGKCGNQVAIEYFSAAFNMVLDLWVVYLPLPTIWTLQLAPQKKWILTASFSLGLGTAAANLGRLIQTFQCQTSADATFCFLTSSIIVFAEFSSGILVACVPMLGPLLRRRRGGSTPGGPTPYKDGNSDGPRQRTIGSIPLRGYRRHKESVLDDSLFSKSEPESVHAEPTVEDMEATTALAMMAANMGHRVEVGWPQGSRSGSSVEIHGASPEYGMYPQESRAIVRTLAYNVDRR
ncbi:hypothetical protein C8A05DRAFT_33459 [Staphylotrichum tortipilum]|uniref:Rhodopsin domain-containing protein n=1 Tax=Staphylotrichum tortipilum TaxID=2831512 RepID=A0AAN6MM73_9PEZI|nr:hypothetical protein C8A05DRAFT_33459 [Staphylotrichum longicolle]